MLCKICQTRRPRRRCPGIQDDICPICCATEREVTVECPLDCEFLQEAHARGKPTTLPQEYPNKDIHITDDFMSRNEGLLLFVSISLAAACRKNVGLIDYNIREALETLILRYRDPNCETKPIDPLATGMYDEIEGVIVAMRKRVEASEDQTMDDSQILGVLAFLQRMEIHHNNGRPKGRAFVSFLTRGFPVMPEALAEAL